MKTEKEKMLSGELYNATDPQLSEERFRARRLMKALNDSGEEEMEKRKAIVRELIPNTGANLWLQPPFYCDYGTILIVGDNVFFNFNCVVLDVMQVKIGSRTLIGPNVQIYTATHPMNHLERAAGLEYARPVTIGDDAVSYTHLTLPTTPYV
jgi:maltose O-acetyltransferase